LKEWIPTIEKAVDFIIKLYDPTRQLVLAPGPLWIDVFIRANFSTDTNAFFVHVLQDISEAEALLGDLEKGTYYSRLAANISSGINKFLWAGDHYITQLNPDSSIRDFVDYDSNLLVTAFNIAPPDRVAALLKRVDGGKCTHARPTYVSEIYYNASNCYLGNTGDSDITMGRIGWVDALTRKNLKDVQTFYDLLYTPVLNDLLRTTWMNERYTCNGTYTHNPYYIEYPEYVVIVQWEVVYGIELGFNHVKIAPISGGNYHFIAGDVDVKYSRNQVSIKVPCFGLPRRLEVSGLHPHAPHKVHVNGDHPKLHYTNSQGSLIVENVIIGNGVNIFLDNFAF